ncbi:MAG: Indolepyruvate C-methyltransferase [Chlamydiae bacterium]|nr:Indolepyruvate C-methyltransferase [Chlamydiota bacterium]
MPTKINKTLRDATTSKDSLANLAQRYISSGVVCHSLVFLKKSKLLDRLLSSNFLELESIKGTRSKKIMVKKTLKELEINDVLHRIDERYYLTEFGTELVKYIGLMLYIYDGYSGLFSNFFKPHFQNLNKKKLSTLINDEAVVLGSDDLAQNFINPFIIRHLLDLDIKKGTICDLGCGGASRLHLIAQITRFNAIGIDISEKALSLAKKLTKNTKRIKIVKDNISHLRTSYPEVTILMQTMVMHDFSPTHNCSKILDSFLDKFPNMEYFFYCDIVAPSGDMKSQLPGFDYIHAMQGIETRTYNETITMFEQSNFEVVSENFIEGLSNTILWVLKPEKTL